jgi:hypothetical protein
MSSQSLEKHQARSPHASNEEKLRYRIFHRFIPFAELREAREDVVDLFALAYTELDDVEKTFSEKCHSELQGWAIEPCPKVDEYNPHEKGQKILSPFIKIVRAVEYASKFLAIIGSILTLDLVYAFGTQSLSLIEALKGMLPIPILFAPSLVLWFWRADTFAHHLLARELRTGFAKVSTRRREKIVGYGVWNRSLLGQTGLLLAGFFFLIGMLPKLPGIGSWFDDPADFVKRLISNNMDIFYKSNNWREAFWDTYERFPKESTTTD